VNLPRITLVKLVITLCIGLTILVGLVAFNHPAAKRRASITIDTDGLWLGGTKISDVIVNPVDSLYDLPDSAWSGMTITELTTQISELSADDRKHVSIVANPAIQWAILKPILSNIRDSGVSRVKLTVDGQKGVHIQVLASVFNSGLSSDVDTVSKDSGYCVMISPDSVRLVRYFGASMAPIRSLFVAPINHDSIKSEAQARLGSAIRSLYIGSNKTESIRIKPSVTTKFPLVVAVARIIRDASGKDASIVPNSSYSARDSEALSMLSDRYLDHPDDEHRKLRVEGLERIYFVRHSATDMIANNEHLTLRRMPVLLKDSAPTPKPALEELDEPTVGVVDHRLPAPINGHQIIIREVTYQSFTMKAFPTWWAVYLDGHRTGIWLYNGFQGKVLTNYQLLDASVNADQAIELRLRGEMFRNGYWAVKGVTLYLHFTDSTLKLHTVVNSFSMLSDKEFRTESLHGDTITEFRSALPPRSVLTRCHYTSPVSDENWVYSWSKLQSTCYCINSHAPKTSSKRAISTSSFIEVGAQ